jgi:hypothetical protein
MLQAFWTQSTAGFVYVCRQPVGRIYSSAAWDITALKSLLLLCLRKSTSASLSAVVPCPWLSREETGKIFY